MNPKKKLNQLPKRPLLNNPPSSKLNKLKRKLRAATILMNPKKKLNLLKRLQLNNPQSSKLNKLRKRLRAVTRIPMNPKKPNQLLKKPLSLKRKLLLLKTPMKAPRKKLSLSFKRPSFNQLSTLKSSLKPKLSTPNHQTGSSKLKSEDYHTMLLKMTSKNSSTPSPQSDKST